MQEAKYTVHIEPAEEGGFVAYFPVLPGCHTQGETLEEVIGMAKDALTGYLECLRFHGDPIPVEAPSSNRVGIDLPVTAALVQ